MEEELIEGILNKDERIMALFINSYKDGVYHQACRMLGNRHDAEEVCQDVFVKALMKIKGFKGQSKLSTWLYKITYTTCLDVIKKKKKGPLLVDMDQTTKPSWTHVQTALQKLESTEQRTIIDKAISCLEPTDSGLIDLYHLQEKSIGEISEITGMTKGAIKVRLLRARKKLAVYLENLLPVDTIDQYRNEQYGRG